MYEHVKKKLNRNGESVRVLVNAPEMSYLRHAYVELMLYQADWHITLTHP